MEGTTEHPPHPDGLYFESYPSDYLLITEIPKTFTYPEPFLDAGDEANADCIAYIHVLEDGRLWVKTGIGQAFYERGKTTRQENEWGLGRWNLIYATG